MELILASRNAHKLREFSRLLAPHEVVALPEGLALPPEDGDSFIANARIKALAAAGMTGAAVLADDSGIEAAALGGAPGIRSARFAGEGAGEARNLAKLLAEVPDGPDADRRVTYVCALVCIPRPGATALEIVERCEGELARVPRGEGGFGYDPAFIPRDLADGRSMAELSDAEKDAVSHRGRAARALEDLL